MLRAREHTLSQAEARQVENGGHEINGNNVEMILVGIVVVKGEYEIKEIVSTVVIGEWQ